MDAKQITEKIVAEAKTLVADFNTQSAIYKQQELFIFFTLLASMQNLLSPSLLKNIIDQDLLQLPNVRTRLMKENVAISRNILSSTKAGHHQLKTKPSIHDSKSKSRMTKEEWQECTRHNTVIYLERADIQPYINAYIACKSSFDFKTLSFDKKDKYRVAYLPTQKIYFFTHFVYCLTDYVTVLKPYRKLNATANRYIRYILKKGLSHQSKSKPRRKRRRVSNMYAVYKSNIEILCELFICDIVTAPAQFCNDVNNFVNWLLLQDMTYGNTNFYTHMKGLSTNYKKRKEYHHVKLVVLQLLCVYRKFVMPHLTQT